MRTIEEIQNRIKEIEDRDWLGTQRQDLFGFLPFEQAKSGLMEGVTEAEWEEARDTNSREHILKLMLDYMEFAWDKANNCRGLSSGRSIDHYRAWLWLLEDDLGESLSKIYCFYGKPCLVAICEKYGWDWRKWDDDCWRNAEESNWITAGEARRTN